jgi:hypothetical protein
MPGSDAHSIGVFANLPGFSANKTVAENLIKCCLQVVETARDKKRLKSVPR